MTSATSSIGYSPLPDDRSIRLVQLREVEGRIHGSFCTTSLDAPRSYVALSYTWGSLDKVAHLATTEGDIPITHSLHSAFRAILSHCAGQCPYVWADAICINQDDLVEKSKQIALMADIYSSAKFVVAYLGEEADDSHLIPAVLETLQSWQQSDPEPAAETEAPRLSRLFRSFCRRIKEFAYYFGLFLESSWLTLRAASPSQGLLSPFITPLNRFLVKSAFDIPDVTRSLSIRESEALIAWAQRPYWRRRWIIQEFARPENLTVLCGHWSLPRQNLDPDIFETSYQRLMSNGSLFYESPGFALNISSVLPMLFLTMYTKLFHETGTRPPLLSLAVGFPHSQCADPRDRLFALLGLAEERGDPGCAPDYSAPLHVVCKRFGQAIAQRHERRLQAMLMQSGADEQNPDLPSWFPNWVFQASNPVSSPLLVSNHPGAQFLDLQDVVLDNLLDTSTCSHVKPLAPYTAGSPVPVQAYIDATTLHLRAAGVLFDAVKSVSGTQDLRLPRKESEHGFYDDQFIILEARRMLHALASYPTGESLDHVLSRSICEDLTDESDRLGDIPADLMAKFQAYFEFIQKVLEVAVEREPFRPGPGGRHSLLRRLRFIAGVFMPIGRRQRLLRDVVSNPEHSLPRLRFQNARKQFCVTESGWAGFVPGKTKPGDLVCIIAGLPVPLILTSCKSPTGDARFRIVGSAYIHGIMDGAVPLTPPQLQMLEIW